MPRSSRTSLQHRAQAVAERLAEHFPQSTCALVYASPFQLLVATVLSAQTTDAAVNGATQGFFAQYPNARDLARARLADVERAIQSIGLWRAKARNIHRLAQLLVEHHGGEVPRSLEALLALPGVGRKTASAVLGTAYAMPVGVTVDTHMLRINSRLGLSKSGQADAMADDLEKLLPQEQWVAYTHRIIDHGRLYCTARAPRCGVCPLADLCPSRGQASVGYKPSNDAQVPASSRALSWLARQ